jgi:16S rRNA (cytidine1402-2'-O)-methyltransferase
MTNKGTLFLIPNTISANTHTLLLTPQLLQTLPQITQFLAEDVRTARRFLSALKIYESIEALKFQVLDKNTPASDIPELLQPLISGHNMGIISESGCPGIADPGALAVKEAHRIGIRIIPFIGPSSILLSLMASGLNGQKFAFHGYLPVDGKELKEAIRSFEKESRAKNQTQIFIETPYRNNSLLQNLVSTLSAETLLTIALDITGELESIQTKPVKSWKQNTPDLPKLPAVFLFLAS